MNNRSKKATIQIADLMDETNALVVSTKKQVLESEEFEIDLSGDENQDCSQIIGGRAIAWTF